jgi:hypothetical protein
VGSVVGGGSLSRNGLGGKDGVLEVDDGGGAAVERDGLAVAAEVGDGGAAGLVDFGEDVKGVDAAFLAFDLEVEVLAVGVAGVATEADDLALADDFVLLDPDFGEVGVHGGDGVAVVEDDVEAVFVGDVAAGEGDLAVRRGVDRRLVGRPEADVYAVGVLGAHRAGEAALGGPDEPGLVGDADAQVGWGEDGARRGGGDGRAGGDGGDVLGRAGGRDGIGVFAAAEAAEEEEVDRGSGDTDADEPREAEHDLVLAVWVHIGSARTTCLNPKAVYTITCSG